MGPNFITGQNLLPLRIKGERCTRGRVQSEKRLEGEATTGHKQAAVAEAEEVLVVTVYSDLDAIVIFN